MIAGLYFGREVPADSEEAKLPLHGPNQWPGEVGLPAHSRAAALRCTEAFCCDQQTRVCTPGRQGWP